MFKNYLQSTKQPNISAASIYNSNAIPQNPNAADRNSIASPRNPFVTDRNSISRPSIQDRSPHNPFVSPRHANATQYNLNVDLRIRMSSIDNAFAIDRPLYQADLNKPTGSGAIIMRDRK